MSHYAYAFQKNTEKTAQAMKVFNPDRTWKKVEKVSP